MAMVPDAYIANTISSFEDLMSNKMTKVLGITNEAKKLVDRLEKVLDVLEDAERKRMGDGDVRHWLAELREVAFESEKVIDYCRIEARKIGSKEKLALQKVPVRPRLLASCFSRSGLRDEILKCMRTLNLKMKAILKQKSQLNLQQVVISDTCRAAPTQNQYRSRSSENCFGATIETDTEYLVNLLTKEETNDDEEEGPHHHLMAIVGVSGIGKTTLARKIFDDKRIRGTFDLRIWISLYSGLKDTTLLANIIDAAGGTPGKSKSRARLEPKLATAICKKRFLIVLDDVSDGTVWEKSLKAPLRTGARGSRILVTTRDKNIATEMAARHVHDVKRLSPEDGWLLLCESSCLEAEDESDVLVEIGLKLSERCDGLPLAIKTVGGILKSKEPTIKDWQSVYESRTWSIENLPYEIPHALFFGYADLPLNLKQCFLYCTLFARNFYVDWRDLIKQWVAEGFLVKRDGLTLEEIGEEYYREMVERYLVNPEPAFDETERCNMHDCLVNMARLLSADEISVNEIDKLGEVTFRPFHISLASNGLKKVPEEVKTKEKLRTLILSNNELKDDGLREVFARLRMLRVLDISGTLVEKIPNTLQNLLHLRYLNLSRTKIKELPESTEHLPFLQYLILQECKRLHSLPKGIEQLQSLRNLDLTGTIINRFFFRIGKLMNLNSLDFFNVNNEPEQQNKGWSLGELKSLNKLRRLCILQIDRTRDVDDAKEASLGTKQCMKELELSCSNEDAPLENPILTQKVEGVIDELRPPPCLETLKIVNYFGKKYPSWLFIGLLSNLRQLELINCQFCQILPPLGQLPQLQFLYIANADFRDIGADIIGTGQEVPFPKLEKLHFQSLHKLESWTGLERPGLMPCLRAFQLESCPEIKFLPSCMNDLTRLKELRIIECKSLELIKDLTRLNELSVWNTPNLTKISNLTSLEELSISHCPNLQTVKNVGSLKSVQIFDYDLEAIPRWLKSHAIQIQSLDLTGTVEMLQRCLVNGPDWDIIQDIAQVYGHSTDTMYFSYNRTPFSFETNLSVPVIQQANSLITETVSIETIVEENQEGVSKEESPIVDMNFTVSENARSNDSSSLRSVHDDEFPTISTNPSSPPIPPMRDDILVNMSENISGPSNSDTDTIGTRSGSLVRRNRKNNITEVSSIAGDKNAKIRDPMPSNLVFNFDFGMPTGTTATEETLISKQETKLSHKEENLIIDEIITISATTRNIEPSGLTSLHDNNSPTISINPISPPPSTTIRDSVVVNMSENSSGLTNSDTDSLDQSARSLVRRRHRKNNIAEVVSIDADKNANTRDSIPSLPSNLVLNFDSGMPIDASATDERSISKLGTVLSHKSSGNNLNQNASDLLHLDVKTENTGHQTIKKHTVEKSRDSSSSNLLYSDPNVSTNEEELVERTGTVNRHNSEKQASEKDTSLNFNFSSNLKTVPIQIQGPGNYDTAREPVTHKDKVENANLLLATLKKAMNDPIYQLKGTHQSRKIDKDDSVKQPTRNAISPGIAVAGSSTSGTASKQESEVNGKLQKKERLKDYMIVVLLAVTVMQLFLILWLIWWFMKEIKANRS